MAQSAEASTLSENKLPGFGLALEQESKRLTAQEWFASPMTVRERAMLRLIGALKDKAEWDRKVFDDEIVAKWRAEALLYNPDHHPATREGENDPWGGEEEENGENLNMDGKARQKVITEKVFDYCISELRENAKHFQKRGFTEAIDADACVYFSDTAVSADAKQALVDAATRLENVPDRQKDWHPGSNEMVLNLVHPSLFPLIYGRSRILRTGTVPLDECASWIGKGEIVPKVDSRTHYSAAFQWLPCDVSVDADGQAKITSYINNLHPADHQPLYAAIEKVITTSIPLWIQTLLSTQSLANERVKLENPSGYIKPDGVYDDNDLYQEIEDEQVEVEIPEPTEYSPRQRLPRELFTMSDQSWRISEIEAPLRARSVSLKPAQIEAGQATLAQEEQALRDTFAARGLQVIVKLANIQLTPAKPRYAGGSWHIEGLRNEHIAASALYYYSSANVGESWLAFREGVDADMLADRYAQNLFDGLMEMYGINASPGNAVQVVGRVQTREDRLLVFPNVLQHRVSPFELADASQPGHRRLLALFLVDPHVRVPSTAHIPPQQRDWWARALDDRGVLAERGLPPELADQVVAGVTDFPISLAEARTLRGELMDERRAWLEDDAMEPFRENSYNFCEH